MAVIAEPSPQADLEEVFRLIAEGDKVTDPDLLKTDPGTLGASDPRSIRKARLAQRRRRPDPRRP
jgi:hypothetical protein